MAATMNDFLVAIESGLLLRVVPWLANSGACVIASFVIKG